MFQLKGRVAVITGASSGLGKQMAKGFASQGADLVIMARRLERLEELKSELEQLGVRCLPVKCDVTNPSDIKNAALEAERVFGKVDILVNCAGSAKNNGVLKSGVDSTINPTLALYVKSTAPDYQSVKNSGYDTVASSDLNYKKY